jgi:inosine/xanthosine triphosphate pyrophosphatase family protein
MKLIFSTGNSDKFHTASTILQELGIELSQAKLDIDEIQSEEGDAIIRDKSAKAYALVGQPVIVTDDSWAIPGLGGFPGPYMKSINTWFKVEDFAHLTGPLEDRRIFLINRLAYNDGHQIKLFHNQREGILLPESRGHSTHLSHQFVVMEGDNGLSQAEAYSRGIEQNNPQRAFVWKQLAEWLKSQISL